MLTRKLLDLVFPQGLLLLAVVALLHWGARAPAAAPIVRLSPLVILSAGALLGWRFQRGRLLLALLGLTLADRAMLWLAPLDFTAPFAGPAIVRSVAILLPTSLAVLAYVGERGLLTDAGLRRLAVLFGQASVVLVLWLVSAIYPEHTARAFDLALLSAPPSCRSASPPRSSRRSRSARSSREPSRARTRKPKASCGRRSEA